MNYIKKISKDWVLTIVLFFTLATVAFSSTMSVQNAQDAKKNAQETKKLGTANQRFIKNFSSYLECLIVSDPAVVEALGRQAYFDECNKLFFRGTGLVPEPVTKVTLPPSTTTTTTAP